MDPVLTSRATVAKGMKGHPAMTMNIELHHRNCSLSQAQEARIMHQLDALGGKMNQFPEPTANLRLEQHDMQRRVTADLRLQMGPGGQHLISHQAAETADRAALLAIQDVERQLERELSHMRRQHTFGVPSRRMPAGLRPNPPAAKSK